DFRSKYVISSFTSLIDCNKGSRLATAISGDDLVEVIEIVRGCFSIVSQSKNQNT
ncbi:unnamed protein product, partial [Adineta steineri]